MRNRGSRHQADHFSISAVVENENADVSVTAIGAPFNGADGGRASLVPPPKRIASFRREVGIHYGASLSNRPLGDNALPIDMRAPLRYLSCVRWLPLIGLAACISLGSASIRAADYAPPLPTSFPPPLESYDDSHLTSVGDVLWHRAKKVPFNVVATLLFLSAVLHTFFTHKFRHIAHRIEDRHKQKIREQGRTAEAKGYEGAKDDISVMARLFHFLGEIEAVFGIWVVPLVIVMAVQIGITPTKEYIDRRISYHEPLFVVVIMAISATRPILRLAESCMKVVAGLGKGSPVAWWFSILTLGPLLGSLITEPAAMTISALLLGRQFYARKPPTRLAYATLGLLFVNVSVGGTLTHFAAPPVLMVAGRWGWDTPFMARHFGLPALLGIIISNLLYYFVFRRDFAMVTRIGAADAGLKHLNERTDPIPVWVTIGHVLFMGWSVWNAHAPAFLIGGFLFFLAFLQVTEDYQGTFDLRSPILVGFFLAGLVIHGGLQQWWIAPVLGRLGEAPLMIGAAILTAFNDNAAITYLATLVPGMTDAMKHAVVAGAVTGGGLTVIANAPNPAGQSILSRFFEDGISPFGLLLGALAPTVIIGACFLLIR